MKIIKRLIYNNGYGCTCCMLNQEISNWIDIKEALTPKQLFQELTKARHNKGEDHLIAILYEKDGKILYGYKSRVFTMGEDHYVIIDNVKYLYYSVNEPSKETKKHIRKSLNKYYEDIIVPLKNCVA